MEYSWNPWHGCKKCSEGCLNCYMYFLDKQRNPLKDSSIVAKTNNFKYPLTKNRNKSYKIPSGARVMTNMTSDTFIIDAYEWLDDFWNIIKIRSDLTFFIITKRPERIPISLPKDWEDGYDNVILNVTCENQKRADERVPILRNIPAKHKGIICAPLLEEINIETYLQEHFIEEVSVGGENYNNPRPCHYEWIKSLQEQCLRNKTNFSVFETGTNFWINNKQYWIPNKQIQHEQAKKMNLDISF